MKIPPTLLAVDNTPGNLMVLKQELRRRIPEIDVLCASDAATGIDIAAQGGIDAALIDSQLQRIDGIEVCRRLRADPTTTHLPIVLIVPNQRAAGLRLEGLKAGAATSFPGRSTTPNSWPR